MEQLRSSDKNRVRRVIPEEVLIESFRTNRERGNSEYEPNDNDVIWCDDKFGHINLIM